MLQDSASADLRVVIETHRPAATSATSLLAAAPAVLPEVVRRPGGRLSPAALAFAGRDTGTRAASYRDPVLRFFVQSFGTPSKKKRGAGGRSRETRGGRGSAPGSALGPM